MRTTGSMIAGVVVLALTLGAWLYGETHGVDTEVLWNIVPALLIALFIGAGVAQAGSYAQQAAQQTNGSMSPVVKAAVAAALAERDAARTRQSVGDISTATSSSAETVTSSASSDVPA